ncbi:hypothetical protein [Intestinibacter sp.]|nr:hypothetical protein [Intestinibacter sp.]MDY2736846.1 hypothetical protein [Intestinibacter sp.]
MAGPKRAEKYKIAGELNGEIKAMLYYHSMLKNLKLEGLLMK